MSSILLAGTALTVLLLDLAARRLSARTVATPVGGTYLHNLDWLADRRAPDRVTAGTGEWSVVVLDDLTEAERVLDGLEACGFAELEMRVVNDTSFAIRWR